MSSSVVQTSKGKPWIMSLGIRLFFLCVNNFLVSQLLGSFFATIKCLMQISKCIMYRTEVTLLSLYAMNILLCKNILILFK